jgi:hypothetical protein
MKNLNNLALGLGVAVIGFAVYQYMKSSTGSSGAATAATGAASGNAGAMWQTLTFPMGSGTGGVNSNVYADQTYSSASWNPDAISSAIAQDSQNALQAIYHVPLVNQFGFTMPGASS